MDCCNIGDFALFCDMYVLPILDSLYPYCQHRGLRVIRKIFFGQEITQADAEFLERYVGYSEAYWLNLANEFNHFECESMLGQSEFLDGEHMPFAQN